MNTRDQTRGGRPPQLAGVLTLVQDLATLIHSESMADLFGHAFSTLTRQVPFDLGMAIMLEQRLDLYISSRPGAAKQMGDGLAPRVRRVLQNVIPAEFTTTEIVVKDERDNLPGEPPASAPEHEIYSILTQESRTAGLILICRATPDFGEDERRVAEIFSAQLSMLLDNLRARQKIISLADRDDLTGIPNRRYFRRQLTYEMERARVYNLPLSLLLIDVDNFKQINDSFGHVMGDVVLSELCGSIAGMLRSPDELSRFGGDEFAVILPHTDAAGAATVADRILQRVKNLEIAGEEKMRCTVSIGIAQYKSADKTLNDIVRRADACLYDAKRQGKNRYNL